MKKKSENQILADLTEEQREIIKSFDSREAVIKRQVELVRQLNYSGVGRGWTGSWDALARLKKELAAINVYLNLKAL